MALFKIERSRKQARGHLGRARMQGFLDRPQGIDVIARFDHCDAAGIEAELVQTMAMKPARGEKCRRRGDDEKRGIAGRDRRHQCREEAQGRRLILRRGGMDLMHAFKRQAFPRQVPVERETERKRPALL